MAVESSWKCCLCTFLIRFIFFETFPAVLFYHFFCRFPCCYCLLLLFCVCTSASEWVCVCQALFISFSSFLLWNVCTSVCHVGVVVLLVVAIAVFSFIFSTFDRMSCVLNTTHTHHSFFFVRFFLFCFCVFFCSHKKAELQLLVIGWIFQKHSTFNVAEQQKKKNMENYSTCSWTLSEIILQNKFCKNAKKKKKRKGKYNIFN